ncbi:hypothetical protein PR048_007299 [Dryococelus australis]|uniref:Uncharacterized protein n=1 Tax=Dryococelus australis TaxID=614101 RepID=A0ABQ9ID78_9NEOP|nr:hypothetical protein PR048_007299 [Dryococelus australis]
MLQSWYLSADMHLFLLAPLIIYPMWRWPICGKILLAACLCAAVAIPLATLLIYHYPGIHYISLHDDMLSNYAKYMYYPTHQRMAPYFVGLALGYLMNSYRNENCILPKWLSTTLWALSLTILSAVIFGPFELMQFHHAYDIVESSMFGGFSKLAWAVSISWIIFACHKGYGAIMVIHVISMLRTVTDLTAQSATRPPDVELLSSLCY